MAAGDNLSGFGSNQAKAYAMRKKGIAKHRGNQPMWFVKAGAPADNTAADSPGAVGRFIYDSTNNDIYYTKAWSSSTSFDVEKVVD